MAGGFPWTMKVLVALGVVLAGCSGPNDEDEAPPDGLAASQSDELGLLSVSVGGVSLGFRAVNAETGRPIPGLFGSAAPMPDRPGRGLLALADPAGQYPMQVIELVSAEAPPTSVTLAPMIRFDGVQQASAAIATVPVSPAGTRAIPAVTTQGLPLASGVAALDDVSSLFDTLQLLLKEIHAAGYGGQTLQQIGTTTYETPQAVVADIERQAADGLVEEVVFLGAGLAVGAAPGVLLAGALLGVAVVATQFALDSATVEACRAQGSNLQVTRVGSIAFLECEGPRPELFDWGSVRPTEERPSSIDFFRFDNLTAFVHCEYEPPAAEVCPVPRGEYNVVATIPGDAQGYGQLMVGEEEAPLELDWLDVLDADLSLWADGLTGFLEQGDTVAFEADLLDQNGTSTYCEPVFVVVNPPGMTVALIDPRSGVLTAHDGPGAARVFARCEGWASNAVLVSTVAPATAPPDDAGTDATLPPPTMAVAPPPEGSVDAATCQYLGQESDGPSSWESITWYFHLSAQGTSKGVVGTTIIVELYSPETAVFQTEPPVFETQWTQDPVRTYYGSDVYPVRSGERGPADPESDSWSISADVSKTTQRSYIPDFAGPHEWTIHVNVDGGDYNERVVIDHPVDCTIPG